MLLFTLTEVRGDADPLRVGVTPSPPFSFEQEGAWTGISIELWEAIAGELDISYVLKPLTVSELITALREGDADVGAAALFTTAERERFMDFSHSFYSGGLSVATQAAHRSPWEVFLAVLVRREFLGVILVLGLVLLAVGFAAWLAERASNPGQFPADPVRGIGSGFWFSAVTMTTVGYGDKSPISLPGRIIALIWMFASILLISTFTGAIASALTVTTLTPGSRASTTCTTPGSARWRARRPRFIWRGKGFGSKPTQIRPPVSRRCAKVGWTDS